MDTSKSGNITPDEIPNVVKAYESWIYEKEYKKTMEELYVKKEEVNEEDKTYFKRALMFISSPQYELIMNIVTIINVFSIFARSL